MEWTAPEGGSTLSAQGQAVNPLNVVLAYPLVHHKKRVCSREKKLDSVYMADIHCRTMKAVKEEKEESPVLKVMKQFRLYPDTVMRLERLSRDMRLTQTQVVEKALALLALHEGRV